MNSPTKHVDLIPPNGEQRVLMHSCCAPCAGELMEQMVANGIDLTIFFYNPNIHPKKEYKIRKEENIRFAEQMGIPFLVLQSRMLPLMITWKRYGKSFIAQFLILPELRLKR